VRRAVLPAAGRGTRLGAIARDGAKELVSVAGRALVEHALADLAASGIAEALIVTSPRKPMLAAMLGSRAQGVALSYVVQEEPRGLADALSLAEEFVAGEPFLCWLPDNLWSGRRPAAAQLLDAFGRAPRAHVVALLQIAAADVLRHGAAGFVETAPSSAGPDLARIVRVLGKGARPPLPSDPAGTLLKGFPLDLWQPDLFDRIRALRARSPPGELDDTPILQELAAEGRLFGAVLRDGRLFDCGIPEGLAAAREAFGDEGA
jgi:glucose-1-phosphate thymidylyltransferase